MATCSGRCCKNIQLWTVDDEGHQVKVQPEWLRVWKDRDLSPTAALMWVLFRPNGGAFKCRALTADGCGIADRTLRPSLCTRYPSVDACEHCGARSDMEARGVALVAVGPSTAVEISGRLP